MPEQFVNPSPRMRVQGFLSFDFPCEFAGEGVAQAPPRPATGSYSAVGCFGNVNLEAPVTETLYGKLGTPELEQGHPFMKEYDPRGITPVEPGDPTFSTGGVPVGHDQVVDIDRGIQIDHTGRLSGSFVDAIASKPYFSQVIVSAVSVAPVVAATASIPLETFTNWLEPEPEAPRVWFWRLGNPATNELLFSAHVRIADPYGQGLRPENVYKLVYQWKFYKFIGSSYPDTPPANIGRSQRMPISGFDEAIAFEVIGATTEDLP